MYERFGFLGADGTRLVGWRNEARRGPRVLVCNGMGVPAEAWPRLIDEDCRFQVAGWNQRGVLGSERPADPARVEIEDHVADAVALLDALGWEDAVVVAWSLGVNVAFELAAEHPGRVAGLLSVAGVPGGTFDTLLAPQLVPRPLRRPLGLGIVRTGRTLGPQLNLLGRVIPKGRPFAELIRHSGVMLPYADVRDVQPWVSTFFNQDWDWYFTLALALERHGRIDPSFLDVPVTILAGTFDALTSHDDVVAFARDIPHAQVHSLPGSHCLPLEFPERILELLDALTIQVEAHRAGRAYLARWAGPHEPRVDLTGPPAVDVRAPSSGEPGSAGVRPRQGSSGEGRDRAGSDGAGSGGGGGRDGGGAVRRADPRVERGAPGGAGTGLDRLGRARRAGSA